ncbi:hypothetical protein NEIMUCOT_05734 [Neisseria mucosa ATCC 25996]|jgi:hypothetical protein|uniref:Uncharacterized protein n=1 Tax=Neisseria mucosa (strain ATCC 25996 / DSM 4631 / NCTC 10774 / M26) TaxID=546266 RepID=D2ZYM0_NEIM2|nr:hypothetical protein NEIMUCOT_05734 [Neisseria mucosa ATCC 25996]
MIKAGRNIGLYLGLKWKSPCCYFPYKRERQLGLFGLNFVYLKEK